MSLETIFEGEVLRRDLFAGDISFDASVPLNVMVNDLLNGRCWVSQLEKDTFCRSLRRRLTREVASLDKVKTMRYYQFPQRPVTRDVILNTPVEDEDQTDVFMYRTNTRLSFKPFRTGATSRHSRHGDKQHAGNPYYNYARTQGQTHQRHNTTRTVELSNSPVVYQNYRHFRPGNFFTGGIYRKNSAYSMVSQSSYNNLRNIKSTI